MLYTACTSVQSHQSHNLIWCKKTLKYLAINLIPLSLKPEEGLFTPQP